MITRPPKHNLKRDGFMDCAEYIHGLAKRGRGCHCVYVAPDGGLRVIPDATQKQSHRPESELVGRYRKGAEINVIEDDLIQWLREQRTAA